MTVMTVLVLSLACDRAENTPKEIFAPAQAGQILAYENPTLPQPQRRAERLQIRITKTELVGASLMVTKTFTTLQGQMEALFSYNNGGVRLMKDPTNPALVMLPPSFPNVRTWTDRNREYRVEGRAMMPEMDLPLPSTLDRLGIWVASESMDGQGPKLRTFYLPNLGEIETQAFQNGKWVSVNRLVEYGFEDAPAIKSPPVPKSAPVIKR